MTCALCVIAGIIAAPFVYLVLEEIEWRIFHERP
jgi:hypothetical protein